MSTKKTNSNADALHSMKGVAQNGAITNNPIQTFKFDLNEIRTVDLDGEVWFVAPDVCAALDIVNPTRALKRLDEDEKGLHTVKTLGKKEYRKRKARDP